MSYPTPPTSDDYTGPPTTPSYGGLLSIFSGIGQGLIESRQDRIARMQAQAQLQNAQALRQAQIGNYQSEADRRNAMTDQGNQRIGMTLDKNGNQVSQQDYLDGSKQALGFMNYAKSGVSPEQVAQSLPLFRGPLSSRPGALSGFDESLSAAGISLPGMTQSGGAGTPPVVPTTAFDNIPSDGAAPPTPAGPATGGAPGSIPASMPPPAGVAASSPAPAPVTPPAPSAGPPGTIPASVPPPAGLGAFGTPSPKYNQITANTAAVGTRAATGATNAATNATKATTAAQQGFLKSLPQRITFAATQSPDFQATEGANINSEAVALGLPAPISKVPGSPTQLPIDGPPSPAQQASGTPLGAPIGQVAGVAPPFSLTPGQESQAANANLANVNAGLRPDLVGAQVGHMGAEDTHLGNTDDLAKQQFAEKQWNDQFQHQMAQGHLGVSQGQLDVAQARLNLAKTQAAITQGTDPAKVANGLDSNLSRYYNTQLQYQKLKNPNTDPTTPEYQAFEAQRNQNIADLKAVIQQNRFQRSQIQGVPSTVMPAGASVQSLMNFGPSTDPATLIAPGGVAPFNVGAVAPNFQGSGPYRGKPQGPPNNATTAPGVRMRTPAAPAAGTQVKTKSGRTFAVVPNQ